MSKYMVLMHPDSNESYMLDNGKTFIDIDTAVKEAMNYGTDDFWIITKVEWEAQSKSNNKDTDEV